MKSAWYIIMGLLFIAINNPIISLEKNKLPHIESALEVLKSEVELRPNEGLVYYKNQPFTGRVMEYYSNGMLAEEIQFQEGIKHGIYQKWFADGTLSYTSTYLNGLPDGISRSWWSNGNLRSEVRQVKGKLDGLQTQWYKSGAKFKERNMNMGLEEGMQRSWRENGKVYNNYEAKHGRIFGLKRASLCFQLDDEEIQIK